VSTLPLSVAVKTQLLMVSAGQTVDTQEPAALHAVFAAHAPCVPAARSPHVTPPEHFAHGPVQAEAQQKSSPPEQLPLAQSAPLFAGLHA
jgi:hypothetical protein